MARKQAKGAAPRGQESQGKSAQVPPTRASGPESATGAALEDRTIPQGEDRGSKVEPEGGWPQPDSESPKPTGAQVEPARFTSNGQLPHNTIPTPTGAVPIGATSLSVEDARAKVDEVHQAHDDYVMRRGQRRRLPAETIQRLGVTELRAIAAERQYDLDDSGGQRAYRQAFQAAQDEDEEIQEREDRAAARKG